MVYHKHTIHIMAFTQTYSVTGMNGSRDGIKPTMKVVLELMYE
jgi:hypothetical protein